MASISIQFYAMPDELAALARTWIERDSLHAAAVKYRPFLAQPLLATQAVESVLEESVGRLILAERPIDCSAGGNLELLDKNEGVLVLDIGRVSSAGLTESRVSATTATPAWRRVAASVRKNTVAGMVGENERSGATATYRSFRYTPGAARLVRSGTPLRQFANSPVRLRPVS